MQNTFKNNNVTITFYDKSCGRKEYILFEDLNDKYNGTTGYTKKVRGVMPIAKAWEFITILFNKEDLKEDLDFNDIKKILDDKFKLSVHVYCSID